MSNTNRLIEKAAKIWAESMRAPVHDNGDDSEQGEFGAALMATNTATALSKVDNIEDKISIFEETLSSILKARAKSEPNRHSMWLDVDYNPCTLLAECAKKVGLPDCIFSIKSSVTITKDYVSASFGYASGPVYYYPMVNDRWLKAKLVGDDVSKIIKSLESGNQPEFEVTD